MAVWPNGSRTRPDFSSTWQSYKGHNGLDMKNFDINHAVLGGTVVTARWSILGGGWIVEILADDGHLHRYLHNLKGLLVKRGQRVETGQRLGYQGSTGKSTGKHLHFAVRKGGRWGNYIDPLPYLQALIGSAPAGGNTTLIIDTEQESDMRSIKNEKTGEHALVGEFTFTLMNAGFANPEAKVWNPNGVHILVSDAEWKNIQYLASQNAKRLAVTTAAPAVIDYAKLAALIKVPTAAENGAAARAAIVKS